MVSLRKLAGLECAQGKDKEKDGKKEKKRKHTESDRDDGPKRPKYDAEMLGKHLAAGNIHSFLRDPKVGKL